MVTVTISRTAVAVLVLVSIARIVAPSGAHGCCDRWTLNCSTTKEGKIVIYVIST